MERNYISISALIEFMRHKSKDDVEFTFLRLELENKREKYFSVGGLVIISATELQDIFNDNYLLKLLIEIKIYHLSDHMIHKLK